MFNAAGSRKVPRSVTMPQDPTFRIGKQPGLRVTWDRDGGRGHKRKEGV